MKTLSQYLLAVIFGAAVAASVQKLAEPGQPPAKVRYVSKSGVLLSTLDLKPGQTTTFNDLESITITTNAIGETKIIINTAP